jgi:hypothetical protein
MKKLHLHNLSKTKFTMMPVQPEKITAGHEKITAGHEKMAAGHEKMAAGHEKMAAGDFAYNLSLVYRKDLACKVLKGVLITGGNSNATGYFHFQLVRHFPNRRYSSERINKPAQ